MRVNRIAGPGKSERPDRSGEYGSCALSRLGTGQSPRNSSRTAWHAKIARQLQRHEPDASSDIRRARRRRRDRRCRLRRGSGGQCGGRDRRAGLPRAPPLDDAGRRSARAPPAPPPWWRRWRRRTWCCSASSTTRTTITAGRCRCWRRCTPQRPDMVIGFEMFPRRVQPVLDSWVAGNLTVRAAARAVPVGRRLEDCRPNSTCRCSSSRASTASRWWRSTSTESSSKPSRRRAGTRYPKRSGKVSAGPRPRPPAYRDFLFEIYARAPEHPRQGWARRPRRPTPPSAASSSRRPRGTGRWPRLWRAIPVAGSAGEKPLGGGHHGQRPHPLRLRRAAPAARPQREERRDAAARCGRTRLQGTSVRPGRCRLRVAGSGEGEARAAASGRAAGRERRHRAHRRCHLRQPGRKDRTEGRRSAGRGRRRCR